MATTTFDTHAFVKRLIHSGFTEEQAEAITETQQAFHDVRQDTQATKGDIESLRQSTKLDIKELELKIAQLKNQLIFWVSGIVTAGVSVIIWFIENHSKV